MDFPLFLFGVFTIQQKIFPEKISIKLDSITTNVKGGSFQFLYRMYVCMKLELSRSSTQPITKPFDIIYYFIIVTIPKMVTQLNYSSLEFTQVYKFIMELNSRTVCKYLY